MTAILRLKLFCFSFSKIKAPTSDSQLKNTFQSLFNFDRFARRCAHTCPFVAQIKPFRSFRVHTLAFSRESSREMFKICLRDPSNLLWSSFPALLRALVFLFLFVTARASPASSSLCFLSQWEDTHTPTPIHTPTHTHTPAIAGGSGTTIATPPCLQPQRGKRCVAAQAASTWPPSRLVVSELVARGGANGGASFVTTTTKRRA